MIKMKTSSYEQGCIVRGFPCGSVVENLPAKAGRDARGAGLIPGSVRSPAGGNGSPRQYSCLENPRATGAWWATVHRVTIELDTMGRPHSSRGGKASDRGKEGVQRTGLNTIFSCRQKEEERTTR